MAVSYSEGFSSVNMINTEVKLVYVVMRTADICLRGKSPLVTLKSQGKIQRVIHAVPDGIFLSRLDVCDYRRMYCTVLLGPVPPPPLSKIGLEHQISGFKQQGRLSGG